MLSACGGRSSRADEILELARGPQPPQRLVHLCSGLATRQDLQKLPPTPAHILLLAACRSLWFLDKVTPLQVLLPRP